MNKMTSIVILVVLVALVIYIGYTFIIRSKILPTNQQVANNQTADWKTYSNNDAVFPVTFKYPSNWTVEVETYSTPAQALSGQKGGIIAYALIPNAKKTPYDTIVIGGRQFDCVTAGQYQSRCVSTKEVGEVHTQSKDSEILGVFDLFVKQFTITKNYKTPTSLLPTSCKDESEGQPIIISLSSYSGSVGSKIEINGCNFSGFEGDKIAWIENNKGEKGFLGGEAESTSKLIKTTLRSPLCQKDTSYSGLPCDTWLTLIPGMYKIYVMPWGKKSNTVDFIVE